MGAPIETNLRTSIIGDDHSLPIFRINPHVMMIGMRGVYGLECFAAITRFVQFYITDINDIFLFGVNK